MLLCTSRQMHRCSSSLALCRRHFVCSYFKTAVLRRLSVLLQKGSVANNFADCNKSDSVGLLQHCSIRAVLASLPGEPTANRPIARPIDRLRLKRLILGPTRRRTRRICSGNVQEKPEQNSQAPLRRPVRNTRTERRKQDRRRGNQGKVDVAEARGPQQRVTGAGQHKAERSRNADRKTGKRRGTDRAMHRFVECTERLYRKRCRAAEW